MRTRLKSRGALGMIQGNTDRVLTESVTYFLSPVLTGREMRIVK